jgi:hypothetical protein
MTAANSKSILGMRVLALLHSKAETKQRIPHDSIRQQVGKVRNVEVSRAFFLAKKVSSELFNIRQQRSWSQRNISYSAH